jgi:hypothetical protein
VSPVHGSVLVTDGTVYCTAGRSSNLDGGIDLCRIHPETGAILSRTTIYSPDPQNDRQPPQSAPGTMPGARSDILSSDGRFVYLRDMAFDYQAARRPAGDAHLFTLTDYLDDTWSHRSYWIFGKHCSIATGCSGRDRNLVYGRLLVYDDAAIYGYGRRSVHWSNHLQDGPYRLFAVGRGDGATAWSTSLSIRVRAMILAGQTLFVAGVPTDAMFKSFDSNDAECGRLLAISSVDGTQLADYPLDGTPVFDGIAAANGHLYVPLEEGRIVCLGPQASGR